MPNKPLGPKKMELLQTKLAQDERLRVGDSTARYESILEKKEKANKMGILKVASLVRDASLNTVNSTITP